MIAKSVFSTSRGPVYCLPCAPEQDDEVYHSLNGVSKPMRVFVFNKL